MGFGPILRDGGKVANAPDQFGPQLGFHHRQEAKEGGFPPLGRCTGILFSWLFSPIKKHLAASQVFKFRSISCPVLFGFLQKVSIYVKFLHFICKNFTSRLICCIIGSIRREGAL